MNETIRKAVIFDMDGTIWDSSKEVTQSWLQICSDNGLGDVITEKKIRDCMGMVMDDIFDKLLADRPAAFRRKIQTECERYENTYLESHCGKVYDGLKEALQQLRSMGYATMIVTNAQDGYVQAFFAGSGMGSLFDDIEMYGRTGLSKADNIRLIMERNAIAAAVYVGDTLLDMQSAAQAGCHFVHAAYGFGSAPEASYSISCPAELPALAARILG
ncbi:MAG: HAD family hydrolase [Firmicutes bacterium]|nr:HAD family hydrolase [Bacillota bacterium]